MVHLTHRRDPCQWGTLPMHHGGPVVEDGRVEPGPTDAITQLIQQGRDREAAALGSERLTTTTGGFPMDPISQLDQVMPMLKGMVAGFTADDLGKQTPCERFAVQGVLEHMIGGGSMFAAAFRGEPAPAAPPSGDPLVLFPKVMDELVASMKAPGALDKMVDAPFGTVPGEVFARFVALDGIVHGWDLATATGQPYDPSDELVAAADEFAHQALADEMRDGDTFKGATEVPADASPIERLVAFTGRTV